MPKEKVKSLLVYFAISLVSVFVVLVGMKVFYELRGSRVITPDLSYVLSPATTNLKVGDKISLPLYLNGRDASKTSAYDIKMYFDTSKFRLTKVLPGGFFDKYITVKWDQGNMWFALAQTPSTPRVPAMINAPVLSLELTAIAKSDSTPVSTGASIVYLTKIGGFHPQMATVNFTIK